MNLQVYRIDRSILGQVGRWFKAPPVAAANFAIGDKILRTIHDTTNDNFYILHDTNEINYFEHALGEHLLDDVYYVRHPRVARGKQLIPAKIFYTHIISEQISEIVSYVRSAAPVKRLRVRLADSAGMKINAKAVVENLPVKGGASVSLGAEHEVVIDCSAPLNVSERRSEYVWMNNFESTCVAIDGVRNGTVKINEKFDLGGRFTFEQAKRIGVSGSLDRTSRYEIECELR
jgi:hypothetical protein